ncbi:MAG: hypothetical protein EOO79_04680 [Oxalobacteraceae bacterium]|nr:MAG: hypothetical protein EOO79_04680 [Oxalobacteraceae bacterium]
MTSSGKKGLLLALIAMAGTLPALEAQAGATVNFGPDQSVSLGFGMRTSYSSVEHGAADGSRSTLE